jgi:hypothetical protein
MEVSTRHIIYTPQYNTFEWDIYRYRFRQILIEWTARWDLFPKMMYGDATMHQPYQIRYEFIIGAFRITFHLQGPAIFIYTVYLDKCFSTYWDYRYIRNTHTITTSIMNQLNEYAPANNLAAIFMRNLNIERPIPQEFAAHLPLYTNCQHLLLISHYLPNAENHLSRLPREILRIIYFFCDPHLWNNVRLRRSSAEK